MKNLIRLKIALADLKELKASGQIDEETYNRELRKLLKMFRELKRESLDEEIKNEIIDITVYPFNLLNS